MIVQPIKAHIKNDNYNDTYFTVYVYYYCNISCFVFVLLIIYY